MINQDVLNFANFLASELRAMCVKGKQLYVTGNMQRSIVSLAINDDNIEVIIATSYASYTDTRGRMAGWVKETIERCSRCYAQNNNVDDDFINGITANIRYE